MKRLAAYEPRAWDPVLLRAALLCLDSAITNLVKAHNHYRECLECADTKGCDTYFDLVGEYVNSVPEDIEEP